MRLAQIADVRIPPRQRLNKPASHIRDLKTSILSKGLLHAPVLSQAADTSLSLIVGECRLTAMRELHEDGHIFTYDGTEIPAGAIPYSLIVDLTPADLAEAELEENLLRAALTWAEENQAKLLIHRLRQSQFPDQTRRDTAKEIAEKAGTTQVSEERNIERALLVESHLQNPRVKAAKSLKEAHRIVLDMHTAAWRTQLVKDGLVSVEHKVLLGDCKDIMPTLPAGSFDLVLTDPPYGIGADKMKKTARHFYNDSPENALEICKLIITEAFRLLKPRGQVFLFCDFEHFHDLQAHAERMAFTTWRTPVIWRKGEDGHAPWGRGGFARTYEVFLYLTKGQKDLKQTTPDIKDFRRPLRSDRVHAAEKPVDLLSHLISISTDPGDSILDPCCGSGPIFPAATKAKVRATGIEIDPEYHAQACSRLTEEPEQELEEEAESEASADELLA